VIIGGALLASVAFDEFVVRLRSRPKATQN